MKEDGYLFDNLDNYSSRYFITEVDDGNYLGYLGNSDSIRVFDRLQDTRVSIDEQTICFLEKPLNDQVSIFFDMHIQKSFI